MRLGDRVRKWLRRERKHDVQVVISHDADAGNATRGRTRMFHPIRWPGTREDERVSAQIQARGDRCGERARYPLYDDLALRRDVRHPVALYAAGVDAESRKDSLRRARKRIPE